jgi:hypothetical protein
MIKNNVRLGAAAILLAIATLFVLALSGQAAPSGSPYRSFGYQDSCVLDSTSSCVKQHGLGVKPDAVTIQETGPGQSAVVTSVTDTTYKVKWNWHDGKTFKAGITLKYYVHLDAPGGSPEPSPTPSPTPTPPPTTATPSPTPTAPPTTPTGSYDCSPAGEIAHFYPRAGSPQGQGSDAIADAPATEKPGQYNVSAEHWAVKPDYLSNLCAYSTKDFYVDVKARDDGDHSVQAYPSMRKIYHDWGLGGDFSKDPKLSTFPQLKASVAVVDPADCTGCVYNDAFDVWLNGIGGNKPELMIWTRNHGQTPYGPKVASNVTIDGRQWDFYRSGNYMAYVPVGNANIPSGTYDLKEFINDVVRRGILPPDPAVSQVSYGVEPVHTGGVFKRWHFTDFSIKEN